MRAAAAKACSERAGRESKPTVFSDNTSVASPNRKIVEQDGRVKTEREVRAKAAETRAKEASNRDEDPSPPKKKASPPSLVPTPPPGLVPTGTKRAKTPPPAEPDLKFQKPAPMPTQNKSVPQAKPPGKKPPPPPPPLTSIPTRPIPFPRECSPPPGLEGLRVPIKAPPPKAMPSNAHPKAKADEAMFPSP